MNFNAPERRNIAMKNGDDKEVLIIQKYNKILSIKARITLCKNAPNRELLKPLCGLLLAEKLGWFLTSLNFILLKTKRRKQRKKGKN